MSGPRVIVVGAGIAGLTAGFRLQQAGLGVTVLEASDAVGGRMASVQHDGFTMNTGAGILAGSYDTIRGLARDVGVGALARVDGTIGIRRDGVIHGLRSNRLAWDGLRTGLVSPQSKLLLTRLALDGLRMRPSLRYETITAAAVHDTETTAAYCQRRLNDEIWRYIAEPVVRGYSRTGTVVEFFFAAINLLGGGFLETPGGIGFLTKALAETLPVRTGARVHAVTREGGGVRVRWSEASAEHSERADACVIAVPGERVPGLYPDLPAQAGEILLGPLRYGTVYVGQFGLSAPPAEPTMLVLMPGVEDPGMYCLMFEHHHRPQSVPEGRGLLASYWEHDWCVARRDLSDEVLIEQMMQSVERVVPELRALTAFTRIDRWPHAAVRSTPGYCTAISELQSLLDPEGPVQLAGDYFAPSSTNTSAVSGEQAAARLIRRLCS